MFSMAMWMAALVAPVQIFLGDAHGINTLEHQQANVMAMEGHFESHPNGAPMILFGLPDKEAQTVNCALEIPKLSSLILNHSLNAALAGFDTVPRELKRVAIVFWSFRVMVAIGFAMLGVGLGSDRSLHRVALAMGPSGLVAVIAGWAATEVSRQAMSSTACCGPPRRCRVSARARSGPRSSPSS